jgi:hypothetical protein
MSQAELAPFHKLVKMVELELALAGQGQAAELQKAVAATGAFIRTLPDPAPPAARPLIERARALRGRVTIDAERLRDGIAAARATSRRRRTMARTYASPRGRNRYSTSA